MNLNFKDLIAAAPDRKRETVTIPEFGGKIIEIREMSSDVGARFELNRSEPVTDADGKATGEWQLKQPVAVWVIAYSLFDSDTGLPLFSIYGPEAIDDEINQWSVKVSHSITNRLWEVAARLNGLLPEQADEAEGKSFTTETSDSSSGLHEHLDGHLLN